MNQALVNLWAKTSRDSDGRWHPLILHMVDVAAGTAAWITDVFPARVGMNRLRMTRNETIGSVPRASGDEPNSFVTNFFRPGTFELVIE